MRTASWNRLALFVLLAPALAEPVFEQWGDADVTTHLGNLSPYKKAPVPFGVSETLPNDCTVDQVMLVRALPVCAGRVR